MSNRCKCSSILFSPECSFCTNRMYEYITFRDEEIIKIRNKNTEKKICKCYKIFNRYIDYYLGNGNTIGICDSCKIDLDISIYDYLNLRAKKNKKK